MRTAPILLALATLSSGCSFDPDQDGLISSEEEELGLDPRDPDTDADGLDDGLELYIGTDPLDPDTDDDSLLDGDEVDVFGTSPLMVDTDGDTYTDADELFEDKDPTSAKSRIYRGYWPYWRDKDELGHRKFKGEQIRVGRRLPRLIAPDQHGDQVDLYDFADPEGEAELIVLAADWFW